MFFPYRVSQKNVPFSHKNCLYVFVLLSRIQSKRFFEVKEFLVMVQRNIFFVTPDISFPPPFPPSPPFLSLQHFFRVDKNGEIRNLSQIHTRYQPRYENEPSTNSTWLYHHFCIKISVRSVSECPSCALELHISDASQYVRI